jgi:hypothetical protein
MQLHIQVVSRLLLRPTAADDTRHAWQRSVYPWSPGTPARCGCQPHYAMVTCQRSSAVREAASRQRLWAACFPRRVLSVASRQVTTTTQDLGPQSRSPVKKSEAVGRCVRTSTAVRRSVKYSHHHLNTRFSSGDLSVRRVRPTCELWLSRNGQSRRSTTLAVPHPVEGRVVVRSGR